MRLHLILFVAIIVLALPETLFAAGKKLTIVHTNDMHSHFLGAPSNIDYTPLTTGDDKTLGGWARIAAAIKTVKRERKNPVLVVDCGDFLMGSLFHMLSREEAFELRLMHRMGYDAVALGNHEFDLKPQGLARILQGALRKGQIPPLVFSNAIFSQTSSKDDGLEKLFNKGVVQPYRVLEKEGLRIGLFGLMGKDAAEVAPFASPVTFGDPIATAKKMVGILRETEQVDWVICLSHSGLSENPEHSEDEILAREVDGIDVIISGHTHTKTAGALRVNDTIIVQAWEYGKQIGVLDLSSKDGKANLDGYRQVEINDAILGDPAIAGQIQAFEAEIDRRVLAETGLSFREKIAETDFDLTIETDESNLGNLIADAMRWFVLRNDARSAEPDAGDTVALISNGVIRDPVVKGETGQIAVCDAFRAIPLGIGFDEIETMGYPLIGLYVYPSEIKKSIEILTSVYPLKGSDYFLQVSGVKFTYNPNRMIFDRVTEIWLGDEISGYRPLDYSDANRTLVRVIADIYNATFLKVIGNFTWDILKILPKDRQGKPIEDLKTRRLDADPQTPGIQELKEWKAVIEFIRNFSDTDGNGLPNIPEKYRHKLGRNVVEASWNPYLLLKRGTAVTWAAFSALLVVILFATGMFLLIRRKIRFRKKKSIQ